MLIEAENTPTYQIPNGINFKEISFDLLEQLLVTPLLHYLVIVRVLPRQCPAKSYVSTPDESLM